MSSALVGALKVSLGLDSAQFSSGLNAAQKKLKGVGQTMQSVGASMARIGAGMTAAITAPIIAAAGIAVREALEMRDALAQVEDALNGVGAAAGRSLGQLESAATGLASRSLYEDDQILRDVSTTLLRFGSIADGSFDRAQQAVLNYAAATKKDLPAASMAIGRALADPEKAAARLTRAGIALTASQIAQIAAFNKAGNAAGAQGVILSALEERYPAAAQAALDAAPPLVRLQKTFNDMAATIGAMILPTMDRLAAAFAVAAERFKALSPEMQKFVAIGLGIAAALGPVLIILGAVVGAIGVLIASPLLPFIAAAAVAAVALGAAFARWHKDIIPAIQAFGKQVSEVLGPKLKPLFEAFAGLARTVGAAFVAVFGGGSGGASVAFKTFGMIVSRVFGAVVDLVTGAINVVTNIFRAFGALLRGDFSGMWNALGSAVGAALGGIGRAFATLFPEVIDWVKKTYEGVKLWMAEKLFGIFRGVIDKIEAVKRGFFLLYDAVIGNSYIPDMVEGIAEWMAKLDAGMVVPARNATDATREAFEKLRDDLAGIMEGMLTDQERAARELSRVEGVIGRGLAAGRISPRQAAEMRAGAAGGGLETGAPIGPLGAMASLTGDAGTAGGLRVAREKLKEAADEFGQRFGDAVERAVNGDIRGAFESIFGDMRSILSKIGTALYQAFSSTGGGGFLSRVASSFFGGKVPGFKTGGSFRVGGSGGPDSQMMQFRASPGEMVDIRRPGQDTGGAMAVHVVPSPYFDVRVEKVAGPIAAQSGLAAYQGARSAVPSEMAERQRYRRA